MSFIRVRTVNGVNYYSLVESVREGNKVRQKLVRYFGKELPEAYIIDRMKKKKKLEKMKRGLINKKTWTIRVNTCDYMALKKVDNNLGMNPHSMSVIIHLLLESYNKKDG
jgi:hypothetical protein